MGKDCWMLSYNIRINQNRGKALMIKIDKLRYDYFAYKWKCHVWKHKKTQHIWDLSYYFVHSTFNRGSGSASSHSSFSTCFWSTMMQLPAANQVTQMSLYLTQSSSTQKSNFSQVWILCIRYVHYYPIIPKQITKTSRSFSSDWVRWCPEYLAIKWHFWILRLEKIKVYPF